MSTSSTSTPPIALLLASPVVLAECMFIIVFAVAAFDRHWGRETFVYVLMPLPFPAVLAIEQLRGTFRSSSIGAYRTAVMLFVVSGIILLLAAAEVGDTLVAERPFELTGLSAAFLIGFGNGLVGWINLHWSKVLQSTSSSGNVFKVRWRFLVFLLLLVGLVCYWIGKEILQDWLTPNL